jgi:hypothetical protein
MTRNAIRVFTAAATLTLCASTAAANSHSASDAQETARQLKELRSNKRALTTKLDELSALARNQHLVSWQSKAIVLDAVRDLVNRSARNVRSLEMQFEVLPEAKRAAVEGIAAELSAIAPEVNQLLNDLRENQLVSVQPGFGARIIAVSNRATEARKTTDRLVRTALNALSAPAPRGD